jgi:hypothetical protein
MDFDPESISELMEFLRAFPEDVEPEKSYQSRHYVQGDLDGEISRCIALKYEICDIAPQIAFVKKGGTTTKLIPLNKWNPLEYIAYEVKTKNDFSKAYDSLAAAGYEPSEPVETTDLAWFTATLEGSGEIIKIIWSEK